MRIMHLTSLVSVIISSLGLLTSFPNIAQAALPTTQDCLICHENPDMKEFFVDGVRMRASVHGRLDCVACHTGVTAPHEALELRPEAATCALCHGEAVREYQESIHSRSFQAGEKKAATCTSCHGNPHLILTANNPQSPTYHLNLPRTCAQCHGDPELAKQYGMKAVYELYMDSIHGRAIAKSGLLVAANCSSCHGFHDIRPSSDPSSLSHRSRIPQTCGACHAGILNVYKESIHGQRAAAGLSSAPVCTDCHTAHEIRFVEIEAWKLEVIKECGSCHSESLRTFRDTYHGHVTALGFTRVARCTDCHGTHDIQPKDDPRSFIHPDRIVATCQKCHSKANMNFAKYDPHADTEDRDRNPVLYYSAWFMTLLLIGVFAFFGTHTILWGGRALVAKLRGEVGAAHPKVSTYYFRFTLNQRLMHGLLILSFFGVVITGMPLIYSDSAWAIWLAHTMGGFKAMGVLHRISALTLTILFIGHIAYVVYRIIVLKERGLLWGPNSMVPQPRDFIDLFRNFLWFFGLGPHPRFGRFTYWEKFDYWAVFWGMAIIGTTGYVLWFPEFFAKFFPGWFFNVAQLVHGEEALLAAGFIFTIHFFNTHLRPEKFPLDLVIFTGRITEAELREERPVQYEQLVKEERLTAFRTEPPPQWLINLSWIVGVFTVALGLALFVLIVISLF